MDALLQFLRKGGVHHAMLLDPRFAAEGLSDDFHAEMAFAVRAGAGMAGMLVRLVDDLERRGRRNFP